MGAKLREKGGYYYAVVHHAGKRKWKKIGQNKREAQKVVHKINAQIALGAFSMREKKMPTVGQALLSWHSSYRPTFSDSYAQLVEINIRRHLIPAFGVLKLDELSEGHILQFIEEKTSRAAKALKASTLKNILSMLGRVMTLAVEEGEIEKNPCRNIGRLLKKIARQQAEEVSGRDSWTRSEVETLLETAESEEPAFYPLLMFLLSTGCRKGEALGLKWQDVDFERGRLDVRRALVRGRLGTPKSGKARSVVLSPDLAEMLWSLLGSRRRACLERGWPRFLRLSSARKRAARSTSEM